MDGTHVGTSVVCGAKCAEWRGISVSKWGIEVVFKDGELLSFFFPSSSFVCIRAMDDAICFRSDILT